MLTCENSSCDAAFSDGSGRHLPGEEHIDLRRTRLNSPEPIEAPADVSGAATALPGRTDEHYRFVSARVLFRTILPRQTARKLSIVAEGATRLDKIERAFAAELLAPAAGIRAVTSNSYSQSQRDLAASHFSVSRNLTDHQIENQLLRIGF